jgi:hypothetical protein
MGRTSLDGQGMLRIISDMKTELITLCNPEELARSAFAARVALRTMSKEEFIREKGSGTLRKNTKLGMDNARQYLDERAAYEFGWAFEARPAKQVTIGQAITEGDSHAITELGWHAERYVSHMLFPGDEAKVAYITVEVMGERREGVGIVITKTSANWLPTDSDMIVFAIVTEWDAKAKDWKEATNPC